MGLRANPSQRQRRLGAELRRMREQSGMSAAEAGSYADLGSAHMSHIETGRTAIPEAKLRALAEAYGCKDKPLIEALVAMGASNGKGWWTEFRSLGASALDFAELEDAARTVRTFQWIYVPGLLQTPEYMRALFRGAEPGADQETLEGYLQFRLRRQDILGHQEPPRLHAVIHEAALHMRFVGAEVMRRQIEHLVEMSRLPHVRIELLPFQARVYPAAIGAFTFYEPAVRELGTVQLEHPVSAVFLTGQRQLAQYADAFERLSTASLPPLDTEREPDAYARRDSLALVQHLLYTL